MATLAISSGFLKVFFEKFNTATPKRKTLAEKFGKGFFVIALGFEPRTACLEGRCSIQLSYAT